MLDTRIKKSKLNLERKIADDPFHRRSRISFTSGMLVVLIE